MSALQPVVPARIQTLGTLFWAEAIAFSRSWRGILWTVALPVLILVLGASRTPAMQANPAPILTLCGFALITGTFSLGLMGYATTLASYRERGVFQLLRCTPAPASQLLAARLLVQLLAVLAEGVVVLVASRLLYGVSPEPAALALMFPVLLLTGLAALALGQVVAALTRQAGTTTAVARVLLIASFLLAGAMGGTQWLPEWLVRWSPVRLAQNLLSSALVAGSLNATGWWDLGALVAWIVAMGFVGLRWFQWEQES